MPDLTVTEINVHESVYGGNPTTVAAVVYNGGTAEAGEFKVTLYVKYAGEEEERQIAEQTVSSLAYGRDATVELAWLPGPAGPAALKVVADSEGVIEEPDEENNVLTKATEVLPVPLGETPWPKFGFDLRNTGQSPYLGIQNGIVKWEKDGLDHYFRSNIPVLGADGTIYLRSKGWSGNNYLYAFNSDGSVKWTYELGYEDSQQYRGVAPAISKDGTIYVGNGNYLFALNPDGTLKWKLEGNNLGWFSPYALT